MASRGVPDALAQERHPDRQRDVGEIACATDVAALVFVVWVWVTVSRADPVATARIARA